MHEQTLTLFSIIVIFVGLISLILSLNLNSAVFIHSTQEIPDDSLVSFQAIISNEYATQDGFVLELSRTQKISAYLDYPLNSSIKDELVLVTGRNDADWFNIDSLELVQFKD